MIKDKSKKTKVYRVIYHFLRLLALIESQGASGGEGYGGQKS
jgi:hypothetical protein